MCVCVCIFEGETDSLWKGGSVGVCREGPLPSYVASSGVLFKKIIYCTHFVYLEKRLELFLLPYLALAGFLLAVIVISRYLDK